MAIKQAVDVVYNKNEISAIVKRTSFAHSFSLEEVTISGLAMCVRIALIKSQENPMFYLTCSYMPSSNRLRATRRYVLRETGRLDTCCRRKVNCDESQIFPS